jgi:uncharacterized membrane protein YcaP (DUF421 family)
MTNDQAREFEREYNELVKSGRVLYEQLERTTTRCNAILEQVREANVGFDEIALLFGCELQIEVQND